MSRSIKTNKNQKLKTKQIYEKRGKAAEETLQPNIKNIFLITLTLASNPYNRWYNQK